MEYEEKIQLIREAILYYQTKIMHMEASEERDRVMFQIEVLQMDLSNAIEERLQ